MKVKRVSKVVGLFSVLLIAIIVIFACGFGSRYALITNNSTKMDLEARQELLGMANGILSPFLLSPNRLGVDTELFTLIQNKRTQVIYFNVNTQIERSPLAVADGFEDSSASDFVISQTSSKLTFNLGLPDGSGRMYRAFLYVGINTNALKEDVKSLPLNCGVAWLRTELDSELINTLDELVRQSKGTLHRVESNGYVTLQKNASYDCNPVSRVIPESLGGMNFRRALYLSATTITTLGYGDFVPNNDFARALAAIESVLGILLFGVYAAVLYDNLKDQGK